MNTINRKELIVGLNDEGFGAEIYKVWRMLFIPMLHIQHYNKKENTAPSKAPAAKKAKTK